jgi:uncharacterized protein
MVNPGFYSEEEGKKLLSIARESIKEDFSKEFDAGLKELRNNNKFKQLRGVFVTLYSKKNLRGCIGFPYASLPILEAVYKAVKQSAFSDPRFKELDEKELDNIIIELSILTSPEIVKDIHEIEIGKHGLMCDYLGYSGLLLPQVATEHKMTRLEFLEALCEKAGLPNDTWQNKNFKLYKFEAQIFREE